MIALEILTLLLENTTEDSVEVAISFLKECGQKLTEVSPRGINGKPCTPQTGLMLWLSATYCR